MKSIALKMATDVPMATEGRKRTVIITQGSDPVVVVDGNGDVKEYPVEKLAADQIVDTNGAGDAFVGGFMAQLAMGKDMETCVRCGIWAATLIIQRSGCTVPDTMDFK